MFLKFIPYLAWGIGFDDIYEEAAGCDRMVCTMSGNLSPVFGTSTEEEINDQSIRLSDVGLSDTEPVYSTPNFWDEVRWLTKRLKPWGNQNLWGGNWATHLWFWATVIAERVARRMATLRRPSLFGLSHRPVSTETHTRLFGTLRH